jgi:hypothetical protein
MMCRSRIRWIGIRVYVVIAPGRLVVRRIKELP